MIDTIKAVSRKAARGTAIVQRFSVCDRSYYDVVIFLIHFFKLVYSVCCCG
jgi:hypothetical protein